MQKSKRIDVMNKKQNPFVGIIFHALTFISILLLHTQVNSQQNNIFDEAMESLRERNKKMGEESLKNAIEVRRQMYVNQNIKQEDIYFNKMKVEMKGGMHALLYSRLREEKVNHEQAEKYIDEFISEAIKCQKKSWLIMPDDLKKHIIYISSNIDSIKLAHKMAMEDYKKKMLANGKSEEAYLKQVEGWAKEYKLCERAIKINIENYLK
jgi:hypothetical protein